MPELIEHWLKSRTMILTQVVWLALVAGFFISRDSLPSFLESIMASDVIFWGLPIFVGLVVAAEFMFMARGIRLAKKLYRQRGRVGVIVVVNTVLTGIGGVAALVMFLETLVPIGLMLVLDLIYSGGL